MIDGKRDPLLLPAKVAFERIGIGRDSGYQAVREGRLRVVRIGRRVLIPAAELAAFIEREAGSQSALNDSDALGRVREHRRAVRPEVEGDEAAAT